MLIFLCYRLFWHLFVFKISCHDWLISLSPVVVWMDRWVSVIGALFTHFNNIRSITNLEEKENLYGQSLKRGGGLCEC
jgi:hypothetical protein